MVRIVIQIPGERSCKEWAIIELQGDLETRHPVPLSSKFIGDLHFTHKDSPVLIIGHHILHGKVLTLEKPLAVLTKSLDHAKHVADDMAGEDPEVLPAADSEVKALYEVQAIIRKKILFKTRPKPIIAHVPKKL
ncbi:unnamed protein product [Lymnaea stagnalis]|uniref:Chromosome transmission fidelity protein 8 homolog n=1 Tax=Lymnaea stagnalis TaxID=6523 RepID=A0AAV2HFY9_LYMST